MKLAHYLVMEVLPAYGGGPRYYKTLRLKGIEPTGNELDSLPTDVTDIADVYAYTRDDALVAFGIWRQKKFVTCEGEER